MVSADKVWGSLSSTGRGISYPEGVSPCQPNFLGRSLEMRDSEVAEVCDQTCSLLFKRRSVVLAAVFVRLLRLGIRSHLAGFIVVLSAAASWTFTYEMQLFVTAV